MQQTPIRRLIRRLTRRLTVRMAEYYAHAVDLNDDVCEVCGDIPYVFGEAVFHFIHWPMDAGFVRMCPLCYVDTVNNFRPIPNPEVEIEDDDEDAQTIEAESTGTEDSCIFQIGDGILDDYESFEYPFAMDPMNCSSSSV